MSQLIVDNVSIEFSILAQNKPKSAGILSYLPSYSKVPFRALSDITFTLKPGDRLAVIGKNGAGKTTLLRVLSEILPPTSGRIEVDGVLQSILTISTGLVMSATCSQNIKLKGLSYGLKGQELEAYMRDVRQTCRLDKFLFQPVKSLSSGMRSRLIVSMLGGLKPQILIMDEWINVGDNKQTGRKNDLARTVENTDIFVLATHQERLVRQHCNKCIVLDGGECVFFGDLDEGIALHNEKNEDS